MEDITSYITNYVLSVFDQLAGAIPGIYLLLTLGLCWVFLPISKKISVNILASISISIVVAGIALLFWTDKFLNKEGIGSLVLAIIVIIIVVGSVLKRNENTK